MKGFTQVFFSLISETVVVNFVPKAQSKSLIELFSVFNYLADFSGAFSPPRFRVYF